MQTVALSPGFSLTHKYIGFIALTGHVIKPDWVFARTIVCIASGYIQISVGQKLEERCISSLNVSLVVVCFSAFDMPLTRAHKVRKSVIYMFAR